MPGFLSRSTALHKLGRYKYLYLMITPVVVWYILFKYLPMVGLLVAFTDWGFRAQVSWTGLENFKRLFLDMNFGRAFGNTLIISMMYLVFYFPLPIIIAILLNEIRRLWIKRSIQYIIIVPYFFSWVVIGGIFKMLLSPSGGIVNTILDTLFNIEPIFFFVSNTWFRWILTTSYIWWHLGYGAVIYIATISTIDPQLYDSAIVDGATHAQQVFYITLPCLRSTISIVLMLTLASVLNIFQQVIVMYNPAVYETSEVLRTYAFKLGILNGDFGFATTISLFTSVVSLFLILTLNTFSKKILDERII